MSQNRDIQMDYVDFIFDTKQDKLLALTCHSGEALLEERKMQFPLLNCEVLTPNIEGKASSERLNMPVEVNSSENKGFFWSKSVSDLVSLRCAGQYKRPINPKHLNCLKSFRSILSKTSPLFHEPLPEHDLRGIFLWAKRGQKNWA